jgi:hypothetical protein
MLLANSKTSRFSHVTASGGYSCSGLVADMMSNLCVQLNVKCKEDYRSVRCSRLDSNSGKSYPVASEGTTENAGTMVLVLIWGSAQPRQHARQPLLIATDDRPSRLRRQTQFVITCIRVWINIIWKASGAPYWI